MSIINSVGANKILDGQLSIDSKLSQSTTQTQKNQFLELMVAQLKNQNPLDPQNGGEFLSQLAQFSSVDGIERLNTSISGIESSFKSGQVLQATALVGRSVQVASDVMNYGGSPISGSVELPNTSANVQISIVNKYGEVIRDITLGSANAGNIPFSWDGLDNNGNPVSTGNYGLLSQSHDDGQSNRLNTSINTNVNSVTVGQNSSVILNLAGYGAVNLDQIKQIN